MKSKNAQLRFENITVRVPKAVLDFVREFYGDPKKHLEHEIVDWVRVDLENITAEDVAEWFNLQEAFRVVLGEGT